MGETIRLKAKDGVTISAYQALPGGRPKGGMVVCQEIFGVNHHIRNVADRYAAQGYAAIAPALFDRVEPNVELGYSAQDVPAGAGIRARTRLEDTLADIEAAVGYYGGGIAGMLNEKPKLPVMLHFGEKDQHISMDDVNKIRRAYPSMPVFVYDADHGFNCDERGSYDKTAADLAAKRTLEFFAEHLR